MAAGVVRVADVVVPEIFNPYMQNVTEQKTRIINSGAAAVDGQLSQALAGAGLTFKTPSFKDLDDEAEDIMSDDHDDVYGKPNFGDAPYGSPRTNSMPSKTSSLTEIAVRMSRHKSWSSQQLAKDLIAKDPLAAIGGRTAYYWARRRQAVFMATVNGLFADNDAAPSGGDTHLQFDLTYNAAAGLVFQQGVTEFDIKNFLRGCLTMGDSQEDLGMVVCNSVVYHKMQLNNQIEYVSDAVNPNVRAVPTFLGRQVIVDDALLPAAGPNAIHQTWLFGAGAFRIGIGSPDNATEIERAPRAGNGAGMDILHTRVQWCLHPVGYAFIGANTPAGGPSNAATSGNLAHLDSWRRVYPERKQIKIARVLTIETP
jgi:hypothetical protein